MRFKFNNPEVEQSLPTIQECINIIDNTTDILAGDIEDGFIDDEEDKYKMLIHFLTLVMEKLDEVEKG